MNNKEVNNKIKQAFAYAKRNHSFDSFENALTKVENGFYLKKENCYILDF